MMILLTRRLRVLEDPQKNTFPANAKVVLDAGFLKGCKLCTWSLVTSTLSSRVFAISKCLLCVFFLFLFYYAEDPYPIS